MSKKKVAPKLSSEHRKNFAKFLEFIAQRHNPFTVFSDFLTVAAVSISNNSDFNHLAVSAELQAEREKRFLDTFNKYNEREQKLLTFMFTELVEEMQINCEGTPHLVDVLGELFHELNFNDAWRGQFFTPQHICDMLAYIALSDSGKVKEHIKERGYFTLKEPCCGGGAMIYGAANAMVKIGLNYNKDVLVYAGDIDERCVLMTYIQCSLYGIPAIVQQKNAITDEVLSEAWFTPLCVMYGWKWIGVFKNVNES